MFCPLLTKFFRREFFSILAVMVEREKEEGYNVQDTIQQAFTL